MKWQTNDTLAFQYWVTHKWRSITGFATVESYIHYGIGFLESPNGTKFTDYGGLITVFVLEKSNIITKYLQASTKTIQPETQGGSSCTMMSLHNLAYPVWLSIPCSERMIPDVMCVIDYPGQNLLNVPLGNAERCAATEMLLKEGSCYLFIWIDISKTLQSEPVVLPVEGIKKLEYLFIAICDTFPDMFGSDPEENTHNKIRQSKYHRTLSYHIQAVSPNETLDGYVVRQYKSLLTEMVDFGNMLFCFQSEYFVSTFFQHDGFYDCGRHDQSDEIATQCAFKKCKCVQQSFCEDLFYRTTKGICQSFINHTTASNEPVMWTKCQSGNLISTSKVNDLVSDCGCTADDEPFLANILHFDMQCHCSYPGALQCVPGHPKCYNVSDICVYKLDRQGVLLPCRTGGHLETCRDFKCNMKFKCPQSYCIPLAYLCDSKWDCSKGYDESTNQTCHLGKHCQKKYKCRHSQTCIHTNDVCDGNFDCTSYDDEIMCDLMFLTCLHFCHCLNYAIICATKEIEAHVFEKTLPYVSLVACYASISDITFFKMLPSLVRLDASHNNIAKICHIDSIISLKLLAASHNWIAGLSGACFAHFKNIVTIDLSYNLITKISKCAFQFLSSFVHLDLSHNLIHKLQSLVFYSLNVRIMSLVGNELTDVNVGSFVSAKVEIIITNKYHICCITPNKEVVCTAKMPWYLSCSRLLPRQAMATSLGMVSAFILILNISCAALIWLSSRKHSNAPFKVLVSFVNTSDLLCGLYLTVLLSANSFYKANFAVSEHRWRGSNVCLIIFVISLLFAIVSPIFLVLLSFSRLMVVLYPLKSRFMEMMFAVKVMSGSAFVSAVITVSLTAIFWDKYHSVPTRLCLPMLDPSNVNYIIKLLTILICGDQVFCTLSITIIYIYLSVHMKSLKQNIHLPQTRNQTKSDIKMFIQLVVITSSNLLCWVPSNVVYILAMLLPYYPIDMVIWTVIAVTPINSVINPLAFIIFTVWNKAFRSFIRKCVFVNSESSHASDTTASRRSSCV